MSQSYPPPPPLQPGAQPPGYQPVAPLMPQPTPMSPPQPQQQPLGYASPQTLAYASPRMPTGMNAAWRDGNQLITTRDVDLGDACVKCGAPSQGWRWNKTVYWISPAYLLLILLPFGWIILLIVYLAARKAARLSAGLCPAHRRRRRNGLMLTSTFVIIGIAAFIGGIALSSDSKSSDPPIGVFIVLSGVGMLIAAAITATTMARVLAPKKMDNHYAWFRGAGEGFLQLLNSTA